ncbi:hypothetical protein GCM10010222_44580 [Streptomyces tanashiensis]|uniref:hypothetical protein n=1 Tax=Streptomyces tanashiensis TaxID=67367 RepID=UPI0019BAFFE2|nr:hypothetical protein [Streptomyces tanashiensis]GGS97953.1 hypothetical protein GCM10010222_44580 [Streptomyces tanashiensis]
MTADDMGPALLGTAIVLALLVVRTAVRELKAPGSARSEWSFLRDPTAMTLGAATGLLCGILAWALSGPAGLPWAVLAGLLVARINGRRG